MTTAIKNYATNGFVGTDVETGTTNNGARYARFRLAHTARIRDDQGNWIDGKTTWYTCTAWNNLAGKVAENIHKGAGVIAVGTLTHSSYIDREGNAATAANLRLTDVGSSLASMKNSTPATEESVENDTWADDQPPF